MWPSLKPSQQVALAAAVDPQTTNAVVYSGWVDMSAFYKLMAVVQAGALGALATVDAKFQQAQDNAGTGVKDVAGTSITQLTKAGTDKSATQSIVNLKAGDLDMNNGFRFARLAVTPAVANSPIAATVLGFEPHYGLGSENNAATVNEVVN